MISVIIIEDTHDYRNVLKALLDYTDGFQCLADYQNAEDCLEDMMYKRANVALVDIQLPGMSGVQLVRQLRKQNPRLLCMMCTAYEEDEKVFSALEAGAHAYLLKSSSPAYILQAIEELAQGGSPMSSGVARKVVQAFLQVPKEEFGLTTREEQVLGELAKGLLYKEIAGKLNISIDTVRRHCFNIYEKLHVQNRTEALRKYYGK